MLDTEDMRTLGDRIIKIVENEGPVRMTRIVETLGITARPDLRVVADALASLRANGVLNVTCPFLAPWNYVLSEETVVKLAEKSGKSRKKK